MKFSKAIQDRFNRADEHLTNYVATVPRPGVSLISHVRGDTRADLARLLREIAAAIDAGESPGEMGGYCGSYWTNLTINKDRPISEWEGSQE